MNIELEVVCLEGIIWNINGFEFGLCRERLLECKSI